MHNITGLGPPMVTIKDTTLGPSDIVNTSKFNSSVYLRAMTASPASTLRSIQTVRRGQINTSTNRAQLSNGFLYPRSTVHSVVGCKNNGKTRHEQGRVATVNTEELIEGMFLYISKQPRDLLPRVVQS
ncbi:hypothetical protein BDR06DRAFT_141693 [Suillus hirtellus]|nr:hypothetical protein BDR06DRAFT_141693 [Suillus hirtellus]